MTACPICQLDHNDPEAVRKARLPRSMDDTAWDIYHNLYTSKMVTKLAALAKRNAYNASPEGKAHRKAQRAARVKPRGLRSHRRRRK